MVRRAAFLFAGLLVGCLGENPAFDEPAGASGTATGADASTDGTAGPGTGTGIDTGTGSASASGVTGSTSVPQTDTVGPDGTVLFVVGDPTFETLNDGQFAAALMALGYELQVVDTATAAEAAGMALVVISATVDPSALDGDFRGLDRPIVTWNHLLYPDLGLTGDVEDEDYGANGDVEQLRIVATVGGENKDVHSVGLLSPPGIVGWGEPGNEGWIAATLPGPMGKPALFGYEPDANGADGAPILARRVAFPSGADDASLTGAGTVLFEDCVNWAAQ